MAPYVPYLYLITIIFLNKIYSIQYIKFNRAIIVCLTSIIILLPNQKFFQEQFFLTSPYTVGANFNNVNTAFTLNKILRRNASIAVFWAGSIPYYTNLKSIDMLGKSDPYIASLPPDISGAISWSGMKSVPGHNKYDLNYSIVKKRPTYVQGSQWGKDNVSNFISKNYINVKGIGILLKNSPHVNWKYLGFVSMR